MGCDTLEYHSTRNDDIEDVLKMSSPRNSKATERTSLLTQLDPDPVSDAQVTDNEAPGDEAGNRTVGEDDDDDNPLYEGNADLAKTMWILFPAVSIGILLSAADQTLVATTYGKIGSDLNALNNTSWIATA